MIKFLVTAASSPAYRLEANESQDRKDHEEDQDAQGVAFGHKENLARRSSRASAVRRRLWPVRVDVRPGAGPFQQHYFCFSCMAVMHCDIP
jgi:hypothetical protein